LKRFRQGVSWRGQPRGAINFDAFDLGFFVELRRIELLTSSMPFMPMTFVNVRQCSCLSM
jgi:hypothetical protein